MIFFILIISFVFVTGINYFYNIEEVEAAYDSSTYNDYHSQLPWLADLSDEVYYCDNDYLPNVLVVYIYLNDLPNQDYILEDNNKSVRLNTKSSVSQRRVIVNVLNGSIFNFSISTSALLNDCLWYLQTEEEEKCHRIIKNLNHLVLDSGKNEVSFGTNLDRKNYNRVIIL